MFSGAEARRQEPKGERAGNSGKRVKARARAAHSEAGYAKPEGLESLGRIPTCELGTLRRS